MSVGRFILAIFNDTDSNGKSSERLSADLCDKYGLSVRFWLLLKRFHGSGFHISDIDLILESVRIMQFIIFCDKYSMHAFFSANFSPSSRPRAKQVVLKASPSTDWSEMIVTEIRPFS